MHDSQQSLEISAQIPCESVPQSLAYDGKALWIGLQDGMQIVSVDRSGRRRHQFKAPGEPIGATFANGEFYYVLADENDDRTVHRVDEHGTWSNDAFAVPDGAGSMLSWDGEWLWLSQHYLGLIHRLDPVTHVPLQTIETGAKIYGHTWIGEWLYVSLWYGEERGPVLSRVSRERPNELHELASNDFKMVSLSYDGDALWTNDRPGRRVVALKLPGA